MSNRIAKTLFLPLLAFLAIASCRTGEWHSETSETSALLAYFTPMTPADTLNLSLGNVPIPTEQEVPVPVLYGALDSALFYQMGYMQDTAAMKALAHVLFPLDAEHDAALLELQEGWFAFKYLLLFDKRANQFTHVTPVCEFYGGDGGQIRSESWLFFEDPPRLLTRFSERWLQMGTEGDPDDIQEKFHETAYLQEWLGVEWREVPVLDSSQWLRNLPVEW